MHAHPVSTHECFKDKGLSSVLRVMEMSAAHSQARAQVEAFRKQLPSSGTLGMRSCSGLCWRPFCLDKKSLGATKSGSH